MSIGPEIIICYHCGSSSWLRHQNLPGKPTIFECSVCASRISINVVAFILPHRNPALRPERP